jgi:hypothetical protein
MLCSDLTLKELIPSLLIYNFWLIPFPCCDFEMQMNDGRTDMRAGDVVQWREPAWHEQGPGFALQHHKKTKNQTKTKPPKTDMTSTQ